MGDFQLQNKIVGGNFQFVWGVDAFGRRQLILILYGGDKFHVFYISEKENILAQIAGVIPYMTVFVSHQRSAMLFFPIQNRARDKTNLMITSCNQKLLY